MPIIPYADPDALSPEHRKAFDALPKLNIFAMMAHAPHLMEPFSRFGGAFLYKGVLDPVIREAVILRVGCKLNSRYEVAQHEKIGRDLGMTDVLFAQIRMGPACRELSSDMRLALTLTDELIDSTAGHQLALKPCIHALGEDGAMELVLLAGFYAMVSRFLNTFDVRIEDGGAAGLKMERA